MAKQDPPPPIFIKAGIYNEQVNIPAIKGAVRIYGETNDITTYKSNTVTITQGRGAEGGFPKEQTRMYLGCISHEKDVEITG